MCAFAIIFVVLVVFFYQCFLLFWLCSNLLIILVEFFYWCFFCVFGHVVLSVIFVVLVVIFSIDVLVTLVMFFC